MRYAPEAAQVDARRRQLLQFAALGAVVACFPACGRDAAVRGVVQGERFPDVALPYLDGRKQSFAIRQDIPLLINFWASWCEPCRQEMPSLEKLSTLFHPADLLVVGIAVDNDVNLAREFGLRLGLTFTLLSDADMALSNGVLHIPAFPMTYLLQRDRTIASIVVGERDWGAPEMIKEIESLLAVRRRMGA